MVVLISFQFSINGPRLFDWLKSDLAGYRDAIGHINRCSIRLYYSDVIKNASGMLRYPYFNILPLNLSTPPANLFCKTLRVLHR